MEENLINNNQLNDKENDGLEFKLKKLKEKKKKLKEIMSEINKDKNNLKIKYSYLINILNDILIYLNQSQDLIKNPKILKNKEIYYETFNNIFLKITDNLEKLRIIINKLNVEKSKTILFENDYNIIDFDEKEESINRNTEGIKIDIERIFNIIKKINDDNRFFFKNLESNIDNLNKLNYNKKEDEIIFIEESNNVIKIKSNSKSSKKLTIILILGILLTTICFLLIYFII